jgi:hypothetical protein
VLVSRSSVRVIAAALPGERGQLHREAASWNYADHCG